MSLVDSMTGLSYNTCGLKTNCNQMVQKKFLTSISWDSCTPSSLCTAKIFRVWYKKAIRYVDTWKRQFYLSYRQRLWWFGIYEKKILGSIALLSHNTLKWSAILGLSFFVQCWWPWESVLQGSSALSEFHTSLSKVLTLWHYVKVKQHYLRYYRY